MFGKCRIHHGGPGGIFVKDMRVSLRILVQELGTMKADVTICLENLETGEIRELWYKYVDENTEEEVENEEFKKFFNEHQGPLLSGPGFWVSISVYSLFLEVGVIVIMRQSLPRVCVAQKQLISSSLRLSLDTCISRVKPVELQVNTEN